MPDPTGPSLPDFETLDRDFGSLNRGRFTYLPVVPGRLEFAIEVRRRIIAERPDVVAVELPETLEDAYLDAIRRLPQISVIFYNDTTLGGKSGESVYSPRAEEDRSVYVPVEPADPFVEAIRTAQEIGARLVFADPDSTERPHVPDTYPDSYALHTITHKQYVEAYRLYPAPRTPGLEQFAQAVAWKLQGADPAARVMVVISLNMLDPVLDAMEAPQQEPARRRREQLHLVNPHPECLGEITSEYPFLQDRYEQFRQPMAEPARIDRRRVQFALFREADQSYELNTGEKIHAWQRRLLAKYSRNLAVVNRDLTAALFDLTIAARSIVDENYAWEVWETASRYGPQQTASDIPTVNISGDEIWLNTRRIRLRRRLPSTKRRMGRLGLKPRKKEKFPGEWASELNGANICSYPPEDMIIENFGRFLKKKGKSVLSEERTTVEPFTSSLLDGIDLRETIRNWHDGKIFVRNIQKVHGEVGSVVVIFDEDRDGRYNYLTTWLGEHQNESDMAFYSTAPFDHLIGPGIGRAEYGGFLMSLPARRMYDVWADPDYDFAETKAERLLLAGLDYSVQKYVVYVAAKPPRSVFRNVAARFGRTIVYVPIGQLSPVTMKKIRVVHVLDGYDKRAIAKDVIWQTYPGRTPLPFPPAIAVLFGHMAQMVHGVDPANNETLAEIERKTGPNNFYRAMAHKPDVLSAFPKLYGAIMGPGTLDRRLKEMVYLAVCFVNECKYCTEAHLKGARKAGLSGDEIENIENETNRNFTAAEQAALHYAREMTRACADEFGTRASLQEYFSEDQLVELTLVVAMANFTNRFNNGLNVQVEHETALSTPVAR